MMNIRTYLTALLILMLPYNRLMHPSWWPISAVILTKIRLGHLMAAINSIG